MYISTHLPEEKYTQPVSNRQINEALAKAKLATGREIRIEERSYWNGQQEIKRYYLYLEVNAKNSEYRIATLYTDETTKESNDVSAVEALNFLTGMLYGLELKGVLR